MVWYGSLLEPHSYTNIIRYTFNITRHVICTTNQYLMYTHHWWSKTCAGGPNWFLNWQISPAPTSLHAAKYASHYFTHIGLTSHYIIHIICGHAVYFLGKDSLVNKKLTKVDESSLIPHVQLHNTPFSPRLNMWMFCFVYYWLYWLFGSNEITQWGGISIKKLLIINQQLSNVHCNVNMPKYLKKAFDLTQ
jgi:hypothetical protein